MGNNIASLNVQSFPIDQIPGVIALKCNDLLYYTSHSTITPILCEVLPNILANVSGNYCQCQGDGSCQDVVAG